jgi:hypothetical protein
MLRLGASLEAVIMELRCLIFRTACLKRIQIPENYTIIQINRKQVKKPQDVIEFFNNYKGRVYLVWIKWLEATMQLSILFAIETQDVMR